MPRNQTPLPDQPRRRRWARLVLALGAGVIGVVLAAPWALNTGGGRAWLLGKANRALAPGRLELDSLRFSWFGATHITAFTLVDAQGDRVVVASRAVWDRNLWQALFGQPKLGTLRLEQSEIDLERLADGKIDLYETLRPILGRDPKTSLRIEVADGRLRLRGTGIAKPVVSDHTAVSIAIHPAPAPLEWSFTLANGPVPRPETSLECAGRFDQWTEKAGRAGDLDLRLSARSWPFLLNDGDAGTNVGGELDGKVAVSRTAGKWSLTGDASLARLDVQVAALRASPLAIDTLHGHLDLRTEAGASQVAGRIETGDPPESERHVSLSIQGSLATAEERIDLTRLALDTHFARLELSGGSDLRPDRARRVDLRGSLLPHPDAINAWLGANVEPGARLRVAPGALAVHAILGPDWPASLNGRFDLAIEQLDAFGMTLREFAVLGRLREGNVSLDPIEATLNGGILHLEPDVRRSGSPGGPLAIVFGPESFVKDAEINETVSRRVLAYVAPVLDQATRVRGRVSAELDEATFPLGRDAVKDAKLAGNVVFQDVEFLPNALFQDMLTLVGQGDRVLLRLDEPAAFSIADRRVYQEGLKIPIGRQGDVELEGWVDFDGNLDLSARVPILPNALARFPILAGIAAGERLSIPIRGTLNKPEIDKSAFNLAAKDLERSLLGRTLGTGIPSLIRRMAEAPPEGGMRAGRPRLSPEERKLRRREKLEERQRKRAMQP